MFYTDRRTVFEYKKINSPNLENVTFFRFAYVCQPLDAALNTLAFLRPKVRSNGCLIPYSRAYLKISIRLLLFALILPCLCSKK